MRAPPAAALGPCSCPTSTCPTRRPVRRADAHGSNVIRGAMHAAVDAVLSVRARERDVPWGGSTWTASRHRVERAREGITVPSRPCSGSVERCWWSESGRPPRPPQPTYSEHHNRRQHRGREPQGFRLMERSFTTEDQPVRRVLRRLRQASTPGQSKAANGPRFDHSQAAKAERDDREQQQDVPLDRVDARVSRNQPSGAGRYGSAAARDIVAWCRDEHDGSASSVRSSAPKRSVRVLRR